MQVVFPIPCTMILLILSLSESVVPSMKSATRGVSSLVGCLQFRRQRVQSQIQQILWVWNREQYYTYITAVESARQSSAVSCGMFYKTTHSHTFSEELIACATGDANMSSTFSRGHSPVDTNCIITGTDYLRVMLTNNSYVCLFLWMFGHL